MNTAQAEIQLCDMHARVILQGSEHEFSRSLALLNNYDTQSLKIEARQVPSRMACDPKCPATICHHKTYKIMAYMIASKCGISPQSQIRTLAHHWNGLQTHVWRSLVIPGRNDRIRRKPSIMAHA